MNGRKACGRCKEWLALEVFRPNPLAATGYDSWCRPCAARIRKEAKLRNPVTSEKQRGYAKTYREKNPEAYKASERRQAMRKFGLTPDEYDAMWESQEGLCAICGEPETAFDKRKGAPRKLAVDHCHVSGDHRGLLCGRCNTAIGLMLDNPDRLRLAAKYIERSR